MYTAPPKACRLIPAACTRSLELLLDACAPADLPSLLAAPTDRRGRSPLHFAAANGDWAAAQLLVARGADVDVSMAAGAGQVWYNSGTIVQCPRAAAACPTLTP